MYCQNLSHICSRFSKTRRQDAPHLILCGLPGVGKSFLGQEVAKRLSLPFIDTDHLIEKLGGSSCRELFRSYGEKQFRKWEAEAISSLQNKKASVIATGGGALLENGSHLQSMGVLFFLKRDLESTYAQLIKDGIPSYLNGEDPKKSFEKMVQDRYPIYESLSDVITESVEEILEAWEQIRLALTSESPPGENRMEKRSEWSLMDVPRES